MAYRDNSCPACRAVTTGDCGQHGAITIAGQPFDPNATAVSIENAGYAPSVCRHGGLERQCEPCGLQQELDTERQQRRAAEQEREIYRLLVSRRHGSRRT